MTKVWLVVPARAGSKGVANKNFREFSSGQSMAGLALNFANLLYPSGSIVLSSDFTGAASLAQANGAEFHHRDEQLSGDQATATELALSLVEYYQMDPDDVVVYLQPTSPLRSLKEASEALEFILDESRSVDSLTSISLSKISSQKLVYPSESGEVAPVRQKYNHGNGRQSLPPEYFIDGNFFMFRVSRLLRDLAFPIIGSTAWISKGLSVDVDDALDWLIAKAIFEGLFPTHSD